MYFARRGCLSPLRVPGDVPGRAEVGTPSELSRCLPRPREAGSTLVWPPGRGGEKGLCLVLSPDQPGHHRPWLSLGCERAGRGLTCQGALL